MKNIWRAVIDTLLVVFFAAIVIGKDLSVLAHEIVSLAFCLCFALHLIINSKTLFASGRQNISADKPTASFSRPSVFFVNILSGAALLINIVSGLLISELIPALNVGMPIFYKLHSFSFLALMILLTLHLCMHLGWLKQAWQKVVKQKAPLIQLVVIFAIMLSAGVFFAYETGIFNKAQSAAAQPATTAINDAPPSAPQAQSADGASESQAAINTAAQDELVQPTNEPAALTPGMEAMEAMEAAASPIAEAAAQASPSPSPQEDSQTRSFTLSELSRYNGQNGEPAYMAVDGIVYDVSSCFRNGRHKGYNAGEDLSAAFHDEHSARELEGLPVVGTLRQ